MADFTGGNDEQLAAGAVIGGTANVLASTAIGTTSTSVASWIAAHCGCVTGVKFGILVGLNPHLGAIALCGGAIYLVYKYLS